MNISCVWWRDIFYGPGVNESTSVQEGEFGFYEPLKLVECRFCMIKIGWSRKQRVAVAEGISVK